MPSDPPNGYEAATDRARAWLRWGRAGDAGRVGRAGWPGRPRPGHMVPRSGQRQAVGVDGDEVAVVAQQHRPISFGRDGDQARPQAVEHVARVVPGALDPGGRAAGRGVGSRLVPVAAAHRDRRGIPGQPPGQRSGPVRVEPAPVPDLDQRRAAPHRADPADRPGERVVDRQQAARRLGGIQPFVRLPAEVDPADVAERASVPAVGRDLLAGQQGDPIAPGRAASSAWWLTVLWSVTAMKSRPRPAARTASSATVSTPSECTVCVCRSPASQRRPARAGRERRGGRTAGGGGAGGSGVGRRPPLSGVVSTVSRSARRPAGRGAPRSSPATSRPRSPQAGTRAWPPRGR